MKYVSLVKTYIAKFSALPPVVVFLAGGVIGYVIKAFVR